MVNDAEKFAEEDKKQREAIDARNAVRIYLSSAQAFGLYLGSVPEI